MSEQTQEVVATVNGVPVSELGEYAQKLMVKYEDHTKTLQKLQSDAKNLEQQFAAVSGAREQISTLLQEIAEEHKAKA